MTLVTRTGPERPVLDRQDRPDCAALGEWDRFVAAAEGTDVTQLSVWSRVRAMEGFTSEYLFVREGDCLRGGAQILLKRIPGLGRVGYVSYGPLVAPDARDAEAVADVLARGLTRLPGVRMLFVQPPEGGETARAALLRHGWRPSRAGIAPTGSVRLDVRQDDEVIRQKLPPRIRSWIRRWPELGVSVRQGDERDVPLLAELMRASAEAQGYRAPSPAYLAHMYRELTGSGAGALFIGELHGRPVTADLVTMCGPMVRGRLGGFDRTGDGGRVGVPAAARWEIIQWARQAGYRWVDFGGLSEKTLRDAVDNGITSCKSWPSADQAKMRYGGVPYRYPATVELIRPAPVRLAYDLIARAKWGRAVLHRVKVALRSSSRLDAPPPAGAAAAPEGEAA